MPELELEIKEGDTTGKRIGILAALIAVVLAAVTIFSHRAHTQAVILKTEVNDQWSFYQSKRLRGHTLDLGIDMLTALSPDSPKTKAIVERYEKEKRRYTEESNQIKSDAETKQKEVELTEHQALRFDIGEGLLELGMVLCSLYFIARRTILPVVGASAAVVGTVVAISGLLLVH